MFSKTLTVCAAVLLICCVSARAEVWTISDNNVKVDFDDATGLFKVLDKKADMTWEQSPAKDAFTVGKVQKEGNTLNIPLTGAPDMTMTLALSSNSDLLVTLTPKDSNAEFTALNYPGPLVTPSKDYYVVYTDAEGILVPAGDPSFPISKGVSDLVGMSGLSMSWVGITDSQFKKGYMVIVDTPDDAGIRIAQVGGLYAPEIAWKPSMQKFSYPRKLMYHFFADGGYVAQAKHYREYVKKNKEFKTFAEKAKTIPQMDKLKGAVHIYLWSDARNLDFTKELKAAGIKEAWIGWDPSHPPYPAKGFDEGVKQLGYLSGVYDLYRDTFNDKEFEKLEEQRPEFKALFLHRFYYPGLVPEIIPLTSDGSLKVMGVSTATNLTRYWVCSKAIVPHVKEKVDKEINIYPHDSVFVDVTLAAGLYECYSKEHPMTRTEDKQARLDIHKIFINNYKMVVGSEFGADYGAPYTDFVHGLMTLHRFRGQNPEGGDWSNLEHPTTMLSEVEPTEVYLKYGINEVYRVPLYELVYHDSTVTSWRWEDNNHKKLSLWDKKDLFNILYGNAPQWNLDEEMWARHKNKFVESYKKISPWLEKVEFDAMTNHRFLTEDRTVQETSFSSGWKVIANFGEKEYVNGKLKIEPMSFAEIKD